MLKRLGTVRNFFNTVFNFLFYKRRRNISLGEQLLASQEGLCFMWLQFLELKNLKTLPLI